VGVGWILLGNGASRFANCHGTVNTFMSHQQYKVSLGRYLSTQPLLSTASFVLLMDKELCRLDGCISMVKEVPFPVSWVLQSAFRP